MFGYTTPSELPNTVAYTMKRPLGVGGHHHAVELPCRHSGLEDGPRPHLWQRPGLQARILDAPLCAVKLAEVFEEAGMPGGVFNLVTGPGGQVGQCPRRGHPRQRYLLYRIHRDRHRPVRQQCPHAQEGAG